MSEQDKTRRETLKLAAAVAAFGAALGYRHTAEATSKTDLKTELKVELKQAELKLYQGGKLVHSCPIPQSSLKQIKTEHKHKLEIKFFVNGQGSADTVGWDISANKKM